MQLTTIAIDASLEMKPGETYIERDARIRNMFIPKISSAVMRERAKRTKPIVSFQESDGYAQYYIQDVSLSSIAYTWDPVKAGKAENLEVLGQIITYHSYGHPMLFKPSIAEVLAQIPEKFLDEAVAFEIVGQPEDADDLNRYTAITNAGYHMAITQFYKQQRSLK